MNVCVNGNNVAYSCYKMEFHLEIKRTEFQAGLLTKARSHGKAVGIRSRVQYSQLKHKGLSAQQLSQ